MDLGADIGRIYLPLFLLFAFIFFFQRARWHINRRRRKKRWGYYPTAAGVGNALQELQKLTRPSVEHVLVEKKTDKEDEDDVGGPDDPTRHIRREMKRIREAQPRN